MLEKCSVLKKHLSNRNKYCQSQPLIKNLTLLAVLVKFYLYKVQANDNLQNHLD